MSAVRERSAKTGLPPGTLVHIGEPAAGPSTVSLLEYGPDGFEERALAGMQEVAACLETPAVSWIRVCGVHDVDAVARVGSALGLHPLVQEDIVNTRQRPKAEIYDDHLFVVLQMIRYDAEAARLDTEQVSLILGPRYVVTFQERPGDVFEAVRQRIRSGKGRMRRQGPDYLAHALMDVVVDHYFLALEALEDQLEDLEEALLQKPGPETLKAIHDLKRVMVALRKGVWPLRELLSNLERSESELIAPSTRPYFRDIYDHSIQVIDTVESFRDVLSGYLDIYLTSVSNRMNEIMKVLTVVATVFIPLTFIAGVYGMNFEHMPELGWRWAYPALWGVMVVLGGGMLLVFRRKNWL
ncbi:MAG: magnesium/cobalt transporter CorA [Deferrisomatales bacterium]|nr:magnesium/cobalt transporter CorA [Deferrisomatales bacterium]